MRVTTVTENSKLCSACHYWFHGFRSDSPACLPKNWRTRQNNIFRTCYFISVRGDSWVHRKRLKVNCWENMWEKKRRRNKKVCVILILIVIPTYPQISGVKLILKWLRNVSVLIHHLQGVYKLCQLKLLIIKMIKCNILMWCYDKILEKVAAYVILQRII